MPSVVTDRGDVLFRLRDHGLQGFVEPGSAASMSGVYLMNGVGLNSPSVGLRSVWFADFTVGGDQLTIV